MLGVAVFLSDTVVSIVYADTIPFSLGVALHELTVDLAPEIGTIR